MAICCRTKHEDSRVGFIPIIDQREYNEGKDPEAEDEFETITDILQMMKRNGLVRMVKRNGLVRMVKRNGLVRMVKRNGIVRMMK